MLEMHYISDYIFLLIKLHDRFWYPKLVKWTQSHLSACLQTLPVCPLELIAGWSVVGLFPTVSPYNSSSVPGWMSRHTRRHTSTHSPTHTSPQAHCTATFCWALLRAWQANLRGKNKHMDANRKLLLNVLHCTTCKIFRVHIVHVRSSMMRKNGLYDEQGENSLLGELPWMQKTLLCGSSQETWKQMTLGEKNRPVFKSGHNTVHSLEQEKVLALYTQPAEEESVTHKPQC